MKLRTKSTLFALIEGYGGDHFHDLNTDECKSTAVVGTMGESVERIISGT